MHKRLARWRAAVLRVGPRSYITLHDTNALTILVLQVRTFHTWLTARKRRGTLHVRGIPPPRDARARPLKRGTLRKKKRQFVFRKSSLALEDNGTGDLEVEGRRKTLARLHKCQGSS